MCMCLSISSDNFVALVQQKVFSAHTNIHKPDRLLSTFFAVDYGADEFVATLDNNVCAT